MNLNCLHLRSRTSLGVIMCTLHSITIIITITITIAII